MQLAPKATALRLSQITAIIVIMSLLKLVTTRTCYIMKVAICGRTDIFVGNANLVYAVLAER